jgi:ureidoglycolate lyase
MRCDESLRSPAPYAGNPKMKLATFVSNGQSSVGVVKDDRIISLTRALPQAPATMIELINAWDVLEQDIRGVLEGGEPAVALTDVTLLAPIARPGKIMAIGLNYADHHRRRG